MFSEMSSAIPALFSSLPGRLRYGPRMIDRQEIKILVDRHLAEARKAMLPRVRNAFDGLLRERRLLEPDPAPYFEALGHPLFELPVWVAGRLKDEGVQTPVETLSDVLGISALGYLHARAQDDWLDGASREDPTLIAVAESLLTLCNRLLVKVVGSSSRFWGFYCEVLNDYAESLLHTDELRRGKAPVSRSTFEQLLAQSKPLMIPSAALLDRADRWELCPHLEEFVFAATAAAQLYNDLTDIYQDRQMGHRTWTIEAIGDSEADQLWMDLAGVSEGREGGRIGERVQEALLLHGRSAQAAQALGLTAAEDWLAGRRIALEGLPRSLRANLRAAFVRRIAGPTAG
jgi:hypothetical protein